jgi:hydroxymethylpyrimidine/phosphomethylpyrimidine kinase
VKVALTIAGSDSIGGAGIQADVKAMGSLDVHAVCVVTAVTAQNTCEVAEVFPVPGEMVEAQFRSVVRDCKISAIKTGMLYSTETVKLVAELLEEHGVPLIIDPVLAAGVGGPLAESGLAESIRKHLMPLCELITPNKYEAEALSGIEINNEYDATLACELIGKEGSSVYLKGGHMDTKKVVDYLYLSSQIKKFEYPRLNKSGHGSGCTLSSFITANCAKGMNIASSVMKSRELIQRSIETQYAIGKGDDVVNPLVRIDAGLLSREMIDELESAASRILEVLPPDFVSKEGINIVYSAPGAEGPGDVAALAGYITLSNGKLRRNGPVRFGTAGQLGYILLSMMKFDPETRSAMNLKYSSDTADLMEELGFTVDKFDRRSNKSIDSLVGDAVKKAGKVPDAIIDIDTKKERLIRVFGKNPRDVIGKVESIF